MPTKMTHHDLISQQASCGQGVINNLLSMVTQQPVISNRQLVHRCHTQFSVITGLFNVLRREISRINHDDDHDVVAIEEMKGYIDEVKEDLDVIREQLSQ